MMIWMVIREFSLLHLWLVVFIALVTVALKAVYTRSRRRTG